MPSPAVSAAENPSQGKLVRYADAAEIAGVVLLLVTLFTVNPLVLSVSIPLGSLLIVLGWLGWLRAFIGGL